MRPEWISRSLIVTLVLYLLATVTFIGHLLTSRESLRKIGTGLVGSAFIVDTLAIVIRSVEGGYIAVASFYETVAMLAWLMAGAYLLLRIRYRQQLAVLGAFISPLAFLFHAVRVLLLLRREHGITGDPQRLAAGARRAGGARIRDSGRRLLRQLGLPTAGAAAEVQAQG